MPLGISEIIKVNFYEMLNLKIKSNYPKPTYITKA
jgi:hypothetical protein